MSDPYCLNSTKTLHGDGDGELNLFFCGKVLKILNLGKYALRTKQKEGNECPNQRKIWWLGKLNENGNLQNNSAMSVLKKHASYLKLCNN